MKADDLMQSITDSIVAAIEAGAGEWKMPWTHTGSSFVPVNAVTKRAYRGGNVLQLWAAQMKAGYAKNRWASYQQWASQDRQVRAGEKGTPIVFWKTLERKGEEQNEAPDKPRRGVYMRVSFVFNQAQVEPPPEELLIATILTDDRIDDFFADCEAKIVPGEPAYVPSFDTIEMPPVAAFASLDDYYATLAHEHAHWTGHESRLNRELGMRFGVEAYAMEELLAELSSAFTCGLLGISTTPRPDHAAYLASWCRVLKEDASALYHIASKAQAATDHLVSYSQVIEQEGTS